MDVASRQFGEPWSCAIRGDDWQCLRIDVLALQKTGEGKVIAGTDRPTGEEELTGLVTDIVKRRLEVLPRAIRSHVESGGIEVDQGYRREIAVADLGSPHPFIGGDLSGGQAEGVAVGLGGGHCRMTDDAGATGAVHYVDGGVELFFKQISNLARDGIRTAASRPGHDEGYRSLGPVCLSH
jgi:hypothetical protein